MSLYFVPSGADATRLQAVAHEFASAGKEVVIRTGRPAWIWADDDANRFAPAEDVTTGIQVVVSGRPAWTPGDWSRALRLPFDGGLSSRLILERYKSGGIASVVPFNGAAVIVVWDPLKNQTHVVTDQFGYHPSFIYRGDNADACILTTFPDAVVADSSARLTYDVISMVEFIRAWRTTPPNTYFSEVKHTGPAAHITIDGARKAIFKETYWRPFEDGFFPSIHAAAEQLATAVKSAVSERTAIARSPLMFISGGADSRVLIFSADDRTRISAVNLYERAAAETKVARSLCEAAGCQFTALQRDNDFYPRLLMDTVRWSGGMWSVEDSHYAGFRDRISQLNADLVMTACTTDWVFKGYGLEKEHARFLGRYLPILRYRDERADGFLPNVPSPAPRRYANAVDERMTNWFTGCPKQLKTPLDRLQVEDRRIRPTLYAVSVSGGIMYRQFPYDTFLADSRVAECYSRIHPDWKLNREVWGKAAARICLGAKDIVDANYGWRVDASTPEKLLMFGAGWIRRRLQRMASGSGPQDDSRPASSGSWPDLGWYAVHSPSLAEFWASISKEECAHVLEFSGIDISRKPLSGWQREGALLFRLLTLMSHWRNTEQRSARARTQIPGWP